MSMFGNFAGPSLADIAAVSRNGNNDGFGGGNGWWVLIILFAIFGGWGNGGYGNGGGNGTQFTEASLQRGFDTQSIIQKLDGINNGICSLGYDQLAQMNGINTNVMQTGFGIQQAINENTVAGMQNANALSTQLSSCCCDLKSLVKDIMYTMAQDTCALKTEIHQTGDAILQGQQWGFAQLNQTIKDGFADIQRDNDRRYIAELERKLNICDRDSALQGMATYVINQVRPTPIPSWNVANPWASYNNGCNNTCGGCCNGQLVG